MKTDQEIDAEIERLEEMKPRVRRTSAFGDNHHDAIDAQVEVLTAKMDENTVYVQYSDEDTEGNVFEAALDATAWLHKNGTLPSTGWEDLVIK